MNMSTVKVRYENEKVRLWYVCPRTHKKVRVYPEFNWGPWGPTVNQYMEHTIVNIELADGWTVFTDPKPALPT